MGDEFFERRVGTVVKGKWTLEKLLGVGGMAAVYVGRHHIGRRDAIKILHPSASRSSELRARFEQEARAVSLLGHRGAVRIDDIDTAEDGSLYLVMELLDGESLGDRLERGGATVEDALRWADELLDVLGAAHDAGIVHRDVKPDNVFLLKDGHVKLLDFGVARMRHAESLKTATGVAIGTLPYMAPEQVRGETVDGRADLFAVGATLVRAIARRAVHDANSEAELYLKMGTQPAPTARALLPSAPELLWPLVDHALAFDRERRYATAAAMRQDVEAVRAGRFPSNALAASRLEPTTRDAAPTLAATVRHTVEDAAPSAPAPRAPARQWSPRLVAVLVGSILAGIGLTVLVLVLVSSGSAQDRADAAPSVPSSPRDAPGSIPGATVRPGAGDGPARKPRPGPRGKGEEKKKKPDKERKKQE